MVGFSGNDKFLYLLKVSAISLSLDKSAPLSVISNISDLSIWKYFLLVFLESLV